MTLRIFEETGETVDVVSLHGWLSHDEVEELERVAAGHGRPVEIDLGNLARVDPDGQRALVRLRAGGARLTGASPYLDLLLERTDEAGNRARDNGGDR